MLEEPPHYPEVGAELAKLGVVNVAHVGLVAPMANLQIASLAIV